MRNEKAFQIYKYISELRGIKLFLERCFYDALKECKYYKSNEAWDDECLLKNIPVEDAFDENFKIPCLECENFEFKKNKEGEK